MNVLLWVLAVLSLIGGTLAGFGEGEPILFAGGFVSFAMLGGFASVITLLKQMSSKISERQNEETPGHHHGAVRSTLHSGKLRIIRACREGLS